MSRMRDLERSVRKHNTGSPRKPKAAPRVEPLAIGPVKVEEVKPNLRSRAMAALRRIFRAPKGR